jgi:Tol biopolymer transport system component
VAASLAACDKSQTEPDPPGTTITWTRLTDSASILEPDHPDWRGDSIAFDYMDSTLHSRVGLMRSDGTGAVLFPDTSLCKDLAPVWVRNGLLVYSSNKAGVAPDNYDLWYRDLAGGSLRRLTSFVELEFGPSPRPGMPSLAYTEGTTPTRGRITLIPDTAAATLTRLYLTPASMVAGEASWDQAGDRICFSAEELDGSRHIWVITLSGTSVISTKQITTGPIHDTSPRFSPDGTKILFVSDRNARSGIWWVSDTGEANGLELISFEDPGATIRSPAWSPDGKGIVLSSNGRGPRAIWVLSDLSL